MHDTLCSTFFRKSIRRLALQALALGSILAAPSPAVAQNQYSKLWGERGEAWSPASRLPDFSFAGYRRGEEPYRIPEKTVSILSFGAKGDGRTDDTQAFHRAIASGGNQVIELPPGRYLLSDQFVIRHSNFVLKGAGANQTIFQFDRSLEMIRPNPSRADHGAPTSGWSWGGGFFTIGGQRSQENKPAIKVAKAARRGENRLELASASFKPGDEILLTLEDDASQSLIRYLCREEPRDDIAGLRDYDCQQVFRIKSVEGSSLILDRGLRFDVRPEWKPIVRLFQPAVTDVGIEGVGFDFPAVTYPGHFKEVGYNPVEIRSNAAHCWLRDLHIHNADSGPYINGNFCTVEGIRLTADPERVSKQGHTGHHGITFGGNDCLATRFTIETRFIHDLTVQSALGCVFSEGSAVDLCMDHHRWAPYENLFTDLDAGEGTRLFASSGGGMRGPHTASGATFWNLRANRTTDWPKSLGVDTINLIGLPIHDEPAQDQRGRWQENFPPGSLRPQNLHQAMLEHRLR